MDTITSLPKDINGNTAIIVIIDCCSRYVTLFPVKAVNAQTGCGALFDVMKHFPAPLELITDNGVESTGIQVEEVIAMMSIHHQTIQPSSHEENSIVERINKEVLRHLRNIVYDKRIRDSWSKALPFVQRILNAERHTATGVAPYEIIFGALAPIDPLILRTFNQKDLFEKRSLSAWSANMLKIQKLVSTVARDTLMANDRYTLRHQQSSVSFFPVNSLVWTRIKRPDDALDRATSKLHPLWGGPYRVLSISEDGTEYHLVHESSGEYRYSTSRMPFRSSSTQMVEIRSPFP